MNCLSYILAACVLAVLLVTPAWADEPDLQARGVYDEPPAPSHWDRETLTDNWFGLGDEMAERGVTVDLSATQVYQVNLDGGLSTHRRSGRYAGSYDLELGLDLERLLQLPGGNLYILAEGSWSEGLDASSIGSLFGVNDDAGGDRSIDVTELWYEQALLGGRLRVRTGKIDLTGSFEVQGSGVAFDSNTYANDETGQFLNGALVNNPSIPFPDNGLGVMAVFEPVDRWYVAGGVADAQADARETGFNTAFHGRDDFFSIFETGFVPMLPLPNGPLRGAYRVGFWYDPQPKERFDDGRVKRDDVGFYLSFDQRVLQENDDNEDTQGLGLFARYGAADDDVNEIRCFWSVGAQYQGLIPTRDEDLLGFGVAQGRLSRAAGFTKGHETAMELYYNALITPWLTVGPSLQYLFNPGGDAAVDGAVVAGLRVQIAF